MEIYTINKGTERGTTFKIDTGHYVFSCLFDSGAEISCMNTETVAALGLIGQMTKSSVSVNTANGENMGVVGDVNVTFKIGKRHSFTDRFVVCDHLTRPFILEIDFLHKCRMTLDWAEENKCVLGYRHDIIAVASQPVTDEPLKLRNAIRIPPRSFAIAPTYCNQMFTGRPQPHPVMS